LHCGAARQFVPTHTDIVVKTGVYHHVFTKLTVDDHCLTGSQVLYLQTWSLHRPAIVNSLTGKHIALGISVFHQAFFAVRGALVHFQIAQSASVFSIGFAYY
jgi:hypothetical protein